MSKYLYIYDDVKNDDETEEYEEEINSLNRWIYGRDNILKFFGIMYIITIILLIGDGHFSNFFRKALFKYFNKESNTELHNQEVHTTVFLLSLICMLIYPVLIYCQLRIWNSRREFYRILGSIVVIAGIVLYSYYI